MSRILRLFFVLILMSSSVGFTQNAKPLDIFDGKGEIYFSFETSDKALVSQISKVISVDNVKGNTVFAYANPKEFTRFLKYNTGFEVRQHPGTLTNPVMRDFDEIKNTDDWDYYPTYDAYVAMMYQFESDFPNICQTINFGTSEQGRELLAVKISDNIGQDEDEPEFLYTATMHGDETAGYVLMLRLIDYLLQNYGSDPEVDMMVNGIEIWINPLANPDGTYAGGNNTVFGAQRYNANGVDLNRNFPDPEDGPHPDGNPWQAETIAFMQLAEDNHFVMSANFHGGAEVINYPWDTWAERHADDAWWIYVSREYADTAQFFSPPGYLTDLNNGITNGWDWYTTAGNRQDYMNYFHQCRECTMEISSTKLLPESQLDAFWGYNHRSFINYIKQCLYGVRGIVTDNSTGQPIEAEIFIAGHDEDSSWVYTDLPVGNYHRLLNDSTYDITFSAPGYYPQTIDDIAVQNYNTVTLDVALDPGNLIADFSASTTEVPVGGTVDFTDMTYGNVVSWDWSFEGGDPATSIEQNPSGIQYNTAGTWDVSLTVSDGANNNTITKEDFIMSSVDYLMQNTTVTTCEGFFYDSGGSGGSYSNDEDFTMTFLPSEADKLISCEFVEFNIEYNSNCDYDWMKVYDGVDAGGILLGTYCGSDSPGTIVASNEDGALTFVFHSDYSVTESGWKAIISCVPAPVPPTAAFTADHTDIFEGDTVQFTDLSTGDPESWSWEFPGGTPTTSTSANPMVIYENAGSYDVTLTVTNEYGSDTYAIEDYIQVSEHVGMNDISERSINVYPNPLRENVLYLKADRIINKVTVYDLTGRIVFSGSVEAREAGLDIGNIKEGLYFLKIETGGGQSVTKLIVE